MTDDIVEQLRTDAEATAGRGDPTQSLLWRASDEIERLRAAITADATEAWELADEVVWLRAEIEHARRALLTAVKTSQDVLLAFDKGEAKRERARGRSMRGLAAALRRFAGEDV